MHALGIYQDGKQLLVALVEKLKKGTEIRWLRSISLEDANVKPFDIISTALAGKKWESVSGLDVSQVFIREFSLKLKSNRAIYAALPFQVEPMLPFSPEQAILLPLIKREKEESLVTLYATEGDTLGRHLVEMEQHGTNPTRVSCAPKALLRLGTLYASDTDGLLLVHVGKEKSLCVIGKNGGISVAQPFKWGSERDLERMIAFIQKKAAVTHCFLSGDFSSDPELKEKIKAHLSSNFVVVEPECDGKFAIPIGLALEHLSTDGASLQFRQGSYTDPSYFKKKLHQTGVYLGSCLAMAALLFFYQKGLISKKESQLFEEFKLISRITDSETLPLGLEKWEQRLGEKKRAFPYQPNVPKTSDLLLWLSTHPQLTSSDPKQKIDIKSCEYTLIKYPKLPSQFDPYQIKVELQFTASSPKLAYEFHEALKKDPFVNTSQEIGWNSNQNSYRAQFVLKNRETE